MGKKLQHDPKEVTHNFFFYQLSDTEKFLLCKDLNFSLPSKRLKLENYLLPFELLYRDVYGSDNKDESLLHFKSKIQDVGLLSHRIYNKKITVLKTYHRKNMTPLSTSVTIKVLLSRKHTKGTQLL